MTAVTLGLAAGDRVVTDGTDRLRDGPCTVQRVQRSDGTPPRKGTGDQPQRPDRAGRAAVALSRRASVRRPPRGSGQ